MNTCVLMAKIVSKPELRYTQEGQVPIAQMLVEFAALKSEDPPATIKVVGWGNLASEIQEQYHEGDQVIIEGRLGMNLIDRPEGFKEKRAELTASRIFLVGGGGLSSPSNTTNLSQDKVVSFDSFKSESAPSNKPHLEAVPSVTTRETSPTPMSNNFDEPERNLDDIPF